MPSKPTEIAAMRALESLTPGGSEYVGDVERCVEFIKRARTLEHDQLLKQVAARKAAEAGVAELVEALESIALKCRTWESWAKGRPAELATARTLAEIAENALKGRATETQGDKHKGGE